jgi:hypothetical protein
MKSIKFNFEDLLKEYLQKQMFYEILVYHHFIELESVKQIPKQYSDKVLQLFKLFEDWFYNPENTIRDEIIKEYAQITQKNNDAFFQAFKEGKKRTHTVPSSISLVQWIGVFHEEHPKVI